MKNKRFLLRIVSLCMVFALACGSFQVRGAEQEVIVINTPEDFLSFAGNCFLNAWSADKKVVLNQDIDLSGTAFESVPVFAGTFDGRNHVISGFGYSGNGYVAGLFRYIEKNGCVENLNLAGEITASDEKECIGSLCGVNYGTIQNCNFTGNVDGETTVGGIAGVNEGTGIIRNCSVRGRVVGYYDTGGIVGRNHGTVNNCISRASVNNDNVWVEEADEMGMGIFSRINVTESDVSLFSGVDSGGIAGYSDGVLIRCTNYGTVGYEHTGYNVGGIAGRQSGVISICKNEGVVYGRKDVGGIVGQMEPYIEVDEAESLRNAVNKLHDLAEKTVDDMGNGKNVVKSDLDALTVYGDGAVDAGNALAGQMADFVDGNMDQAQKAADRFGHVMDMMPDVFDAVISAEESFSKANQILLEIGGHLEELGNTLGSVDSGLGDALGRLARAQSRVNAIIQEMQNNQDIDVNRLIELQKAAAELSDAAAALTNSLSTALEGTSQKAEENLKAIENAMKKLNEAQQRIDSIIQAIQNNPEMDAERIAELQAALRELSDAATAVISSLNTAIGDIGGQVTGGLQSVEAALKRLNEAQQRMNALIQEMQNNSGAADRLIELQAALLELSDASTAVINCLNTIAAGGTGQQAAEKLEEIGGGLTKTMEYLQQALDSIKTATNDVRSMINYVNGQEDIRFSKLGEAFDVNRESLHSQLKGMSGSIKNLSDHASAQTDAVNEDLKAVNNQLNIVFNLLADGLTNYDEISVEELYEDVDIEDIDSITIGKTDNCTNSGIVKGDINVGGIAGSMSVDTEDPEDSAAGSVEYRIGRKYFTKCVITNSVNHGYVTAKKDGAGGIVGQMRHGIVVDSEGYGSVESTEGNYVGGICGESFTVIRHCYALCSVYGGKNVGGIAGFADTLKDCYAIADCHGTGRIGAIAGQTVSYEDAQDAEEVKVSGNYYVGDALSGIDNISYAGVAEPVSYEELLKAEGIPVEFRHLKVIFRVEDVELGTQEIPFGESLSKLQYPSIPEREGHYGAWPDYSDQVMKGNLLITGEYKEDVTVVQSNEEVSENGGDGQGRKKPYALVEQRFTEDTVLTVNISDAAPPEQALNREHVVYDVALEQEGIRDTDTFAVRLYNPYEEAVAWGYKNGVWTKLESKTRGEYLQVDMDGAQETFCVAEQTSEIWMVFACIAAGAAVLALLFLGVKKRRRKPGKRKKIK